MKVFVSVAVTADGYLDDSSAERLLISTPQDWEEVRRLRALYDAILVGAETLRRDNPSLILRDDTARENHLLERGRADLTKVTVTESGRLSPDMRFFTCGEGEKIVFSTRKLPELQGVATVINTDMPVTARSIVTELERRGIERLFVEGGAKTLRMFFDEGMVDMLRLAVNPCLRLGVQENAPKFDISTTYRTAPHICEDFGGMEVATYTLHPDTEDEDHKYLRLALEVSRMCISSRSSYCVGAVVITLAGDLFTGYTHETSPTHHAEQEAIDKALAAGVELRGATIYSSMEPCSQRSSEPESCSELILRLGFARVVFALYEPDRFVHCHGASNLREQGVEVDVYPSFDSEVRKINGHLLV